MEAVNPYSLYLSKEPREVSSLSAMLSGFEDAISISLAGLSLYNFANPRIYKSIFGEAKDVCRPCAARILKVKNFPFFGAKPGRLDPTALIPSGQNWDLVKKIGADFFNPSQMGRKCALGAPNELWGCRAVNYLGSLTETVSKNSLLFAVGFGILVSFFTLKHLNKK